MSRRMRDGWEEMEEVKSRYGERVKMSGKVQSNNTDTSCQEGSRIEKMKEGNW
jgi:hypothetical protein